MQNSLKRKGFTLTELLIVIAIIAILAVIAIPVISGLMNKGTDTTEDVNAALYTTIMSKYATVEPGKESEYPRLTATGADSEYETFYTRSGKGTFPGYNIIAGSSDADVLSKIRREAVIAIKAYSDTAVSDEYYIPAPDDSDYEYVYFYLTGEVKKMKRSDLKTTSATEMLNGVINVRDYWVYLSRDGGSGAALGGVSEGVGHLFIQVVQYGTGQPLGNATVTVTAGSKTFMAVTDESQNGFVGFSGIPVGSVNISVSAQGAVAFPNADFYSKSGEIIISANGYDGCQMNLPYVVELKLGSLGTLGFYEETVSWENGDWVTTREKITRSVTATSAFTANRSNPGGFPRSETYVSNLYETGGTQDLLTGSKFLTYGNYSLAVSSYGYRTYREEVVSGVYGIDNAEGKYSGSSSPYEYPIVMRSPTGQSSLTGTVERESSSQPLFGYPATLYGTWAYYDNYYVYAKVKLTNQATGAVYYSNAFSYNADGKHSYTVSGLPDGTYSFDIESPYKYDDMSDFPETITVDGRHLEVSGKVNKNDAGIGSLDCTITYNYLGNYDPIPGASVTLKRHGESAVTARFVTDADGKFKTSSLVCGFYQMNIQLPTSLGGAYFQYKLFVSGDKSCTLRLSVPSIKLTGTVTPYDENGNKLTKSGTLSDLSLVFIRSSSDGREKYSRISATVDTSGIEATYSVEMVPGYYSLRMEATCFMTSVYLTKNYRAAENVFNISADVDYIDEDNHVGFEQRSDASAHWDECTNCGYIKNHSDHSPSDWTYYSKSYCYRYCTVCKYRVNNLTAHSMSSYVSKKATCTVNGERVYYCTRGCGYSYTDAIAKSGHVGNGVWVYDNNNTHHQNCKNCDAKMNAGSSCSRGGMISNGNNHYDKCSVCSGKRYFDHSWKETSRSGHTCTGGTIYYSCSGCGATKTGSYSATTAHNMRGKCNVRHSCSWNTYCSAKGTHTWNGYYHILCTMCSRVDDSKWCAMHCSSSLPVMSCPY